MPDVSWMRPELRQLMRAYRTIRDVLAGEEAMKGGTVSSSTTYVSGANGLENIGTRNYVAAKKYLLPPNQMDTSPANQARYTAYVERAVWYGATARTLDGLVGAIFERDPQIVVPDELKPMIINSDGSGNSLAQNMIRSSDFCVAYGRGGLLTDFPSTDGTVSIADVKAGAVTPTIRVYAPWQVINWKAEWINGRKLLTQVVLQDDDVYTPDGQFAYTLVPQYRNIYREADGTYSTEIWQQTNYRAGSSNKPKYAVADAYAVQAAGGKGLTMCPFTFFGAKNNDDIPDKPPLQDMAYVNVGHFRNSGDYEDSVHMLGQPTPYAAGLTVSWVNEVWKSKQIPLGSRAVIPLPVGGTMGLLQVEPNTMVYEAMKEKEAMMIKLGAKLIEESSGQVQTATGELKDETSETSVLTNSANNVSAAYRYSFRVASTFVGEPITDNDASLIIKLNTAFGFARMSAGDRQELVNEWQKGIISRTEARAKLRAAGIATQTDAVANAEIAKEQADAIATGIIASPVGVDLPGAASVGQDLAAATPPGQSPNPVPPASKAKPSGKGK